MNVMRWPYKNRDGVWRQMLDEQDQICEEGESEERADDDEEE